MVMLDDAGLPAAGERVQVDWGLGHVTGHVVASYAGIRPRVVVEVDRGQVGDEATTVTVPLSAVRPLDESTSSWAQRMRIERQVAEVLEKVLHGLLSGFELNAEFDDEEVDVVARLRDGRLLFVEVKTGRRPSRRSLVDSMRKLGRLAARTGSFGLVVTPIPSDWELPPVPKGVSWVAWQSHDDDPQLAEAVGELLTAS